MVLRRVWRALVNRVLAEGRTSPQPRRERLQLEALEDRVVPTTWFVSTLGQDVAGGGGQANPFRNIQFAINTAQSGDTIDVAGGTYGYDAAADVHGSSGTLSGFLGAGAVLI